MFCSHLSSSCWICFLFSPSSFLRALSVSHCFPDLSDYFTLLFLLFSLPSLSPALASGLRCLLNIPPLPPLPSLYFFSLSLPIYFSPTFFFIVFYPFLYFLDENLFCLYSFYSFQPISFTFCLLSVTSLLCPWPLLLFPPPPPLCPPGHQGWIPSLGPVWGRGCPAR